MSEQKKYKHWHYHTDDHGILWLVIDRQAASVNTLNKEVFDEFDAVINDIVALNPKGVALISGKKKGFIAGADITQFISLQDTDEAFDMIRQAQLTLDKFEALPMPTVAVIRGFCLGGGCEVALACRYRLGVEESGTLIGLPEVKLGIQPGWGGTVRLPRLIGAAQAMRIMLPGKAVSERKAAKLGLVDAAIATREIERAVQYYLLKKPKPQQPKGLAKYSNEAWVRPILGKLFERQLAAKINKEHYPAPFAIIRNWIKEGVGSNALLTEAKSIAQLLVTETSRNLVRVFFLQERLKSLGKKQKAEINHVHVIGAGTMGGDIAAWCAYKNLRVTLQDQSAEKIAPAIKRAYKLYKNKLKLPRLIQAVMDRLQPDINGIGVAKSDIVIEAIFEDAQVKQDLYKKIEPKLKKNTILATNTSSIPLDELCGALQDSQRLVGIHFFNPVAKMPLVEVVRGKQSGDTVFNQAMAFVANISRLPLPVNSSPGFLVNRCLLPYLLEAVELLEEGASPEAIDKAALDFGMPMGPITLSDKVGLDICLSVAKILVSHYGGKVPNQLQQLVQDGHLGCKTGQGFYKYQKGKPTKSIAKAGAAELTQMADRMILRMLNEAVACLDEKVVADIDLLDAGMIFGTGFAPFRGGPLHYAKQRGIENVVQTLHELAKKHGNRFEPHAGWAKLSGNSHDASHDKDASPANEQAAANKRNAAQL